MSDKFEPVDLNPQPCPDAIRDTHLRAFVTSFILKPHRERCLHVLLDSPKKAVRELQKLDRWLDPEFATELEGSAGFPSELDKRLGAKRGVYFDGSDPSLLLTPAEAATLTTRDVSDAILSIVPGRCALAFHHEGYVYFCERV